jgi:cytochrome c-type biogenesis protein CcmH/NrfG
MRLDQIRTPEDAAADIIDLWDAVQLAMRAMLGGSILSGQSLIRELRQRNTIGLNHANTLASFWDARTRVDSVSYKPTLTDVGYARSGYNALSKVLEESTHDTSATLQQDQDAGAPPIVADMPMPEDDRVILKQSGRRFSAPVLIGIIVGVGLVIGIGTYLMFGRASYGKQMGVGIDLMRAGTIEAAQVQFSQVARDNPTRAEPHVFMARLSRDVGDITTARQQLDTAIRIDPSSAVAQREMGLLLLSQNNTELARRFLIRAIQLAPTDSAAQGYLGCALMKLHRTEEAQRFFSRAGTGSWTSCATLSVPNGTTAPLHQ